MGTLAEMPPADDERMPDDGWAPGPLHPALAGGALDVWRADLAEVTPNLGGLLCESELTRAERIASAREAELWRRSRGLLRELLGRYLRCEPRSLRFVSGKHGKPALAPDAGEPPALSFNVSHSGELALYAFSEAGAVGVDVEVGRHTIDEVAIAARAIGAAEAERLRALDPALRRPEFLRAWARHEATLKCLGVGIGAARGASAGRSLWVAQLELGEDTGAAVAAERAPRELRCWEWRQ
jgi:4'-phosphopantetheinyl transferase